MVCSALRNKVFFFNQDVLKCKSFGVEVKYLYKEHSQRGAQHFHSKHRENEKCSPALITNIRKMDRNIYSQGVLFMSSGNNFHSKYSFTIRHSTVKESVKRH